MGRPAKYKSIEEKRKNAVIYSRKYKEKLFNIENNITEWCEICNASILVDPFKKHRCVFITTTNEKIIFD